MQSLRQHNRAIDHPFEFASSLVGDCATQREPSPSRDLHFAVGGRGQPNTVAVASCALVAGLGGKAAVFGGAAGHRFTFDLPACVAKARPSPPLLRLATTARCVCLPFQICSFS